MAEHRWKHKSPFNFPNLRTFRVRISFILAFLLESFKSRALSFCVGELYYRMKNDFYVLNRRNSHRKHTNEL